MRNFTFSVCFEIWYVVYDDSKSELGLATFQVLMWLVATLLDNTDTYSTFSILFIICTSALRYGFALEFIIKEVC